MQGVAISDLGGTRPPQGLVTQPSAMIFDTTMLIAGVLLLAGAFVLWRLYRDRVLTVVSTLFGIGALGVGIFPGNTTPHPFVAMIAFVFSALTAIAVFRVTSAPFRFMSLSVGLLSLAALIVGFLGDSSPIARVTAGNCAPGAAGEFVLGRAAASGAAPGAAG